MVSSSHAAARGLGKTGVEKVGGAPGTRFEWPDVLRALPDDEARHASINALRMVGLTPDDFGRVRAARLAIVEVLVRAEDRIELGRRRVDVSDLRDLRRAIEVTLWP